MGAHWQELDRAVPNAIVVVSVDEGDEARGLVKTVRDERALIGFRFRFGSGIPASRGLSCSRGGIGGWMRESERAGVTRTTATRTPSVGIVRHCNDKKG